MTALVLKQWELPNDCQVVLPDGREVTFLKMDGMYAKWQTEDGMATGNFDSFVRRKEKYYVLDNE